MEEIPAERCIEVIASDPDSSNLDEYDIYTQEQTRDEDIRWAIQLILENREDRPRIQTFDNETRKALHRNYRDLRVINGLLYHEAEDEDGRTRFRFVLPKQSLIPVLDKVHTSIFGAHLGRKKTVKKMITRFYRPALRQETEEYIRTCHSCQIIKVTPTKRALLNFLKPEHPNQIISSDFAGPFNKTKRGNKYIQVICDCFGKTIVLAASPTKETKFAAQNIVFKWILTYGVPEICLTDGGKEYQSALWDNMCELLDIERVKTTPFHPQCDGQSERTVATTKMMLANYTSEAQDDWDENLEALAFAYNTSVHRITGGTPFSFMFGREARIPIDLMYPNTREWNRGPVNELSRETTIRANYHEEELPESFDQLPDIDPDDLIPTHVKEYKTRFRERLQRSYETLRRNKITRMGRVKDAHDRRIQPFRPYRKDDLVLCSNVTIKKGQSRGIAPKYYGPFVILATNRNGCDYLIKWRDFPNKRAKQVHHNNLKLYSQRGMDHPVTPQSQTQEDAPETPLRVKRRYTKNPNHPRWNREPQSSEASSDDMEADESSSYDEDPEPIRKGGRRRRVL